MKKRFLVLLVLTLLIALTGCSSDSQDALNFDINRNAAINYVKAVVNSYNDVNDIEYDYYVNDGNDLERTAVTGFRAAQNTDHVGQFLSFDTSGDNVEFKNGARGNVLCTILCKYENREVNVTVSFNQNRAYEVISSGTKEQFEEYAKQSGFSDTLEFLNYYYADYGYDLSSVDSFMADFILDQYNQYPFEADECEVSPVYSKSELMKQAGINTAIGMMVVFAVLIFIAFIIYLLRFVPKLLIKEITPTKDETKKEMRSLEDKKVVVTPLAKTGSAVSAAEAAEITDGGNLAGDSRLVAVITAAIYAYEESNRSSRGPVTLDSKDKLIVRSIRRVR